MVALKVVSLVEQMVAKKVDVLAGKLDIQWADKLEYEKDEKTVALRVLKLVGL
jgi:hypothetical protein